MNLEKMICSVRATVREAMICINENCKGIVFVEDENSRLTGIMTDGDIRRLLIDGCGMDDVVHNHMITEFIYATVHDNPKDIAKKFDRDIKIIPIVDDDMKPVNYAEYNKNMHMALAQPHLTGNEYKYLMDAFLSTWISSTGKYVTQFEENFSKYCGAKHGVAVSNGTAALHLALSALGIGKGDEVIVPDITFAATINAVIYTGAKPVIVDVEEDSWCMSPDALEKAITPNTKAVIPVHIYGQPCDMGRICEIAKIYQLYIVEDCAEAHGAKWNNRRVGSFGIISCFSFYGNKVITTGEGGMCITDSEELYEKMHILRDHGMSRKKKYYHEVVGFNYRMTNLQAAIGVAQLERIDDILNWRMQLEIQYRKRFSLIDGVVMQKTNLSDRAKITWLVSMLVDEKKRDQVLEVLKENRIDARSFFIPLSEMELYKKYAEECKCSKKISRMGLNLPTTYEIREKDIETIANLVESVLIG